MPELPEVETVRRTLETHVRGRAFVAVTLDWPGCEGISHGIPLQDSLPGSRCIDVGRRGKYLLLRLDRGRTLIIHLRMTGQLLVVGADTPPPRYRRAMLKMDDGKAIAFCDQRKFGRITLVPSRSSLEQVLRRLGPEPEMVKNDRGDGFSASYLAARLSGRRAAVKAVLLDQRVLAGLGNIYVDEVLFAAGVHPATPSRLVDGTAVVRITEAVVAVLADAVANGGTTLADYRDANGVPGTHQSRLLVFRRHGHPCPRCGATIERSVVAQRGTHACPSCQPRAGLYP